MTEPCPPKITPGYENSDLDIIQAMGQVMLEYNIYNRTDATRMLEEARAGLTYFKRNLGTLTGKRILDIGCGNVALVDEYEIKRLREPWFCRMLVAMGGIPVGVDNASLKAEKFEHYKDSVTNPRMYDRFADNSMDGVHSSTLFGNSYGSLAGSPNFKLSISVEQYERAKTMFFEQTTRVLKKGRILILVGEYTQIYRKVDGKLIEQRI